MQIVFNENYVDEKRPQSIKRHQHSQGHKYRMFQKLKKINKIYHSPE